MITKTKKDDGGVQGWRAVVLSLVLTLTTTMAFAGKDKKVDKDLRNLDPNSTVDVIVTYKNPPDDSKAAKIAKKGGHETKRLSLVKASAVTLSESLLLAPATWTSRPPWATTI